MILILSNAYEPTTDMVIEWLIYKHKDFIRLNSEDMTQVDLNNLMNLSGKFTWLGGQKIDLSAVNVVWYRRWYNYSNIPPPDGTWVGRQLRQELRNEATEMSNFFFKLLGDRKWLSHPFTTRFHNKLYTLFLARKLGIKVPDTIVATQKSVLLDFYRDHPGGIITKPIADPPVYVDGEGTHFKTFTEVLTLDIIRDLPEHFFSSMVQQRVKAKHEIRIYYLDGKFYATAIMNSTTVDIKLSVGFKGMEVNMIPFRLPESLEEKLHRLSMTIFISWKSTPSVSS